MESQIDNALSKLERIDIKDENTFVKYVFIIIALLLLILVVLYLLKQKLNIKGYKSHRKKVSAKNKDTEEHL